MTLFQRIFHPAPDMGRKEFLRYSVATVTAISIGASLVLTALVETFTPEPNYPQGLAVAFLVPLLIVPGLAYWHSRVLYELEESKRKIEDLSRSDGLTGLCNRRHFFELATEGLALAQRHGYPVSLLMIDLDHFKLVNDRFGHQVGDDVLRRVAAMLAEAMRGTDVVARYGGEEFVVFMPHTGAEGALAFCRRLRGDMARRQAGGNEGLPTVTVSMGISSTERNGYDLDRLVGAADDALYRAKAEGRDTCVLARRPEIADTSPP